MAACLITVSGTNGLLRLDYKIGLDSYSINTSIGTLYIEDSATDSTYTTLSGDLIASSGCLTITGFPKICYNIHWDNITLNNWKIDQVILGTNTYAINVPFPNTGMTFVDQINGLNQDEIKVIAGKKVFDNITNTYEYDYILSVMGTEIPIIRISDADSTIFMYLYGTVLGSCTVPVNYESIDVCYTGSAITTTTTSV